MVPRIPKGVRGIFLRESGLISLAQVLTLKSISKIPNDF